MDGEKLNFNALVYKAVQSIPRGKVATYGDIARLVGNTRLSRQVGWALHRNPMPGVIPCHRVVFKDGSLSASFAFGGINAQQTMLEAEGVAVQDGRVNLEKYRWGI